MTELRASSLRQIAVRAAVALGLCVALSGCIVVPIGHHHPYHYYY